MVFMTDNDEPKSIAIRFPRTGRVMQCSRSGFESEHKAAGWVIIPEPEPEPDAEPDIPAATGVGDGGNAEPVSPPEKRSRKR